LDAHFGCNTAAVLFISKTQFILITVLSYEFVHTWKSAVLQRTVLPAESLRSELSTLYCDYLKRNFLHLLKYVIWLLLGLLHYFFMAKVCTLTPWLNARRMSLLGRPI